MFYYISESLDLKLNTFVKVEGIQNLLIQHQRWTHGWLKSLQITECYIINSFVDFKADFLASYNLATFLSRIL